MLRSELKKSNPVLIGALISILYFTLFSYIDFHRGLPVNYFKRLVIAVALGIIYFFFQKFINNKIDSLKK